MGRTGGSRSEYDAASVRAPRHGPPAMRFKLWDTFGASDVAPEITVEHPRIGQRSYFPENEHQILNSSNGGLEISIDDGAWQPCIRGEGCWSYDWNDYQFGRSQAVVRIRPHSREKEPLQACLFMVDLP